MLKRILTTFSLGLILLSANPAHAQTMQRNDLSLTQQIGQLGSAELRLLKLEDDSNSNSKSIAIGAVVLAVISILMNVVTILSARGTNKMGESVRYSESEL